MDGPCESPPIPNEDERLHTVAVRVVVSPGRIVEVEYVCLQCAKKMIPHRKYQLLIDGGVLEDFKLVDLAYTSVDPIDGGALEGCFCGGEACNIRLFSYA